MTTAQALGLSVGILFGFFLQKGRVLRFGKQLGAMLLEDMTIVKFMMSAILVGMVGIQLLAGMGLIKISPKPMNIGAILIGGALFGCGWAIMGFCPGTALGALGEGRWHAIFAILGMLAGAAIYAEMYPAIKASILSWGTFGRITLTDALGISPAIIVAIFWVVTIPLFIWFEKKGL